MARQRTWDGLSENYRKRLLRNGITRELYESGVSLARARGHISPQVEAFRKRARTFARQYATDTYQRGREDDIYRRILDMGAADGTAYMAMVRDMTRKYELGDVSDAQVLWVQRDRKIPDYMYFYHGVFAF